MKIAVSPIGSVLTSEAVILRDESELMLVILDLNVALDQYRGNASDCAMYVCVNMIHMNERLAPESKVSERTAANEIHLRRPIMQKKAVQGK